MAGTRKRERESRGGARPVGRTRSVYRILQNIKNCEWEPLFHHRTIFLLFALLTTLAHTHILSAEESWSSGRKISSTSFWEVSMCGCALMYERCLQYQYMLDTFYALFAGTLTTSHRHKHISATTSSFA